MSSVWTKGTPESTEKARVFLRGFNTVGRLAALIDERNALAAALQRYLDCDQSRDNIGDTPANQARAALAVQKGGA